ncbi:porin [Psychrobacter sp. FDAARGOS_221]|uniref:porin n=1 Tax=Psychrobacter sp. FDAARGOS_221 TaxID=1975705 RepID=UPI000BB575D1|nr:porin [Psychrobacter sp. FDAARGOS_221]PNK60022.1 porin [Psychrobacter sp. FDAARGOS_221]
MIKQTLRTSVFTLVAASIFIPVAQAAPTIYGKAYLTADYVDVESATVDDDELQINSNSSRIGFKGSEAITNNTDVVYQLEYGIDVDGDSDKAFKNRDTYLGLANESFGEIRAGHMQSTTDYVNNVTPAAEAGFWDNLGGDGNMIDSGRIANTLLWKAPKINGMPLKFAAMYSTEEENGDDGFGAALMFDQGTGFTAGVSYESDVNLAGDLIRGTASVDLAKLGNTNLPLVIGGLYQQADIDDKDEKEKGFIVSAEYGLQNFSKPASVFIQYNNTSDVRGDKDVDSDQIVVGGKYYYKKNIIAHLYAGQNTLEVPNTKDRDLFAVGGGLEYKF